MMHQSHVEEQKTTNLDDGTLKFMEEGFLERYLLIEFRDSQVLSDNPKNQPSQPQKQQMHLEKTRSFQQFKLKIGQEQQIVDKEQIFALIYDNEDNELLVNLVKLKLESDIDSYYRTRFYCNEIDMLDKITRSSWFGQVIRYKQLFVLDGNIKLPPESDTKSFEYNLKSLLKMKMDAN